LPLQKKLDVINKLKNNMKKESKKAKKEKEKSVIDTMTDEIIDKRWKEAMDILDILEVFPGSTFEELNMISGFCPRCFERRIVWLEINEMVIFNGEYYWLANED